MMEANKISQQVLDFQKDALASWFDAVSILQDQFEKVVNTALDQCPGLPAQGRKAIENWEEAFKSGRKNFKQQIDNGFEQADKLFNI